MRNKRNKKSSRRVKAKKVAAPLVVDARTRKPSVAITLLVLTVLGMLGYVAYEVLVNGACLTLN